VIVDNQLPPLTTDAKKDCTEMITNKYHCADGTNLHTHGLHVSPNDDDVTRRILPRGNRTQPESYTYHIPADHMMGTHWYHAHYHGSTALQVAGGLFGALLMANTAKNLPTDLSNLYFSTPSRSHLCVLSYLYFSEDKKNQGFAMNWISEEFNPQTVAMDWVDTIKVKRISQLSRNTEQFFVVNGQFEPDVQIGPNDVNVFRFVDSARETDADFFLDSKYCEMRVLARDGVFQKGGKYPVITRIHIPPGGRADIAIKCSSQAKTVPIRVVPKSNAENAQVILTLHILPQAGAPSQAQSQFPSTPFQFPNYLRDFSAPPNESHYQNVTLQIKLDETPIRFVINNQSYRGPNVYDDGLQQVLGESYQRTINQMQNSGDSIIEHPYHQHINHFQIQSYLDGRMPLDDNEFTVGEWRDTAPDNIIMWTRPMDFPGRVVIHCHNLRHEDEGMMALYQVFPPGKAIRRVLPKNEGKKHSPQPENFDEQSGELDEFNSETETVLPSPSEPSESVRETVLSVSSMSSGDGMIHSSNATINFVIAIGMLIAVVAVLRCTRFRKTLNGLPQPTEGSHLLAASASGASVISAVAVDDAGAGVAVH